MPTYIRPNIRNSIVFLTFCLQDRSSNLLVSHFQKLQKSMDKTKQRHPFKQLAWVVLPDHIHCIWKVDNNKGYSVPLSQIKQKFSRNFPSAKNLTPSQIKRGEKGIWQRRFWEHHITSEKDFKNHIDYIHINPVKHGLVSQTKEWQYSSFNYYVAKGFYDKNWGARLNIIGEFGE